MRLSTLTACALLSFVAHDSPGDETPTTPRDHILFLGLDLTVKEGDVSGTVEYYRKRDGFLVASAGQLVPLRKSNVSSFETIREPKIAAISVNVDSLQAARTYSPGTDPSRAALEQQSAMMAYQSEVAQRARLADRNLRTASAAADAGRGTPGAAAMELLREQSQAAVNAVAREMSVGAYDGQQLANDLRARGSDSFNAFEVTFEVSSPIELHNAHAVLLAVTAHPAEPQTPRSIIAFRELPVISTKPQKVTIRQDGLPTGFTCTSYQVHIYAEGREFATTVSNNRTPLSREDAHRFLVLQHTLRHSTTDAPAEIARSVLSPANRNAIPAEQRARTVRVGISPEGAVTSVALDTLAPSGADRAIEAAVRNTLFLPTLQGGRATPSTLTFSLSEFVL